MRRILLLALMQCAALSALTAPAVVGVSLLVRRMVGASDAPGVYAVIDAAAALTAMLAAPVCGLLADRTMSRYGRRRPWLLGGAVLGLAGSAGMAWAPGPLALAAAWMLTQAAYNAVFAAVNGLLAEGLAPAERTRAAGIFSAAAFLGTVPGLAVAALLAEEVRAMLLLLPVLALGVIVPVALRVADPPVPDRPVASGERGAGPGAVARLGAALARPAVVRTGPFLTVLLARLLLSLQLAAGLAFALYLFLTRWGLTEAEAVRATSLTTLTGAVGVVLGAAALTAPRVRRTPMAPVLALTFVLLAVAMLGRGLAPSPAVFHASTAVAGLAIGLGMTATRSLAYALLPAVQAGLGLGLLGAAGSLAGMIGPLGAAALLALGERWSAADPYAGMYLLLAVPALLGLGLVPLLRRGERVPAATSGTGARAPRAEQPDTSA